MLARKAALEAFYGGPVWQANRLEANATMIDSDNVLLLEPIGSPVGRFPGAEQSTHRDVCAISLYYLANVPIDVFDEFFEHAISPRLGSLGIRSARFSSSSHPNNFPRLPVRDRDRVYGWLAFWETLNAMDADLRRFDAATGWRDDALRTVMPALMRKPERLRLAATSRSPP